MSNTVQEMAKQVLVIVVTIWMHLINCEGGTHQKISISSIDTNATLLQKLACPSNEVYIECSYCGPKRCSDLGSPVPCVGNNEPCNPECVCEDGLVRDDNSKCIPKTDCPTCGGDINAKSGCGNHCGKSCSDYMDVNKHCFTGCEYNRCDCKDGFVFHDKLQICVLPRDCRYPDFINLLRLRIERYKINHLK